MDELNDPEESSMAEARQKAFSTSLTIEVGTRVEMIARRENRSYANVIESAVKVFTLLPKDVRDILVESAADAETGQQRLEELSRRMMYHDAMRRLDAAAEAVAKHIKFPPDPRDYDDAVVVDPGP